MKRLLILMLTGLACVTGATAQWTRTGGPTGGGFTPLASENGIVLAAGAGGVARYQDGTWQEVSNQWLYDVMLAGGVAFGTGDRYTYRSSDYGATWSAAEIPGQVQVIGNAFYAIGKDTLFATDDDDLTWSPRGRLPQDARRPVSMGAELYTLAGNNADYLYRTTNDGRSWARVSVVPGATFSAIRTLIAHNGSLLASLGGPTVQRSTDRGETWSAVSEGLDSEADIYWMVSNGTSLWGGAFGGMWRLDGNRWTAIAPPHPVGTPVAMPDGMIFPTLRGTYRLHDTSATSVRFDPDMANSTVSAMLAIGDVIVGTDGTAIHRTSDFGASWQTVAEASTSEIAEWDDTMIAAGGDLIRSTDDGATWKNIGTDGGPNMGYNCVAAYNGVFLLGHGYASGDELGNIVWKNGGVLRSTDGGSTWQPSTTGMRERAGRPPPVYGIGAANNYTVALTLDGMYRSIDGGATWHRAMSGIPDSTPFNATSQIFDVESAFVVITNNTMFISRNGGYQWVLGPPLPAVDPYAYTHLFATRESLVMTSRVQSPTEQNVYTYLFDGRFWSNITDTMPPGVMMIAMATSEDYVYAGSVGRGVWRWTPPIAEVQHDAAAPMALAVVPNPSSGITNVMFELPTASPVMIDLVNTIGQTVRNVFAGALGAGPHRQAIDVSGLGSGTYFVRIRHHGQTTASQVVVR